MDFLLDLRGIFTSFGRIFDEFCGFFGGILGIFTNFCRILDKFCGFLRDY